MPGFDGTGPQGSGKMGRGFGPCHTVKQQIINKPYMHRHAHHQRIGRGRNQAQNNQDMMYDYSVEELNKRKQALQNELQWLDARIKEIGESNENSNTGN